jgi:hypothetical protein
LADRIGAFPFEAAFAPPEFIFVKCNIHSWMKGIFAVMNNSHHAITAGEGECMLLNPPPGNYTITAWHESHGEHIQEVTIAGSEATIMNFVSKA